MTKPVERDPRLYALQHRLTKLVEANLQINDGLDLDIVLQRVLDNARSLIGAHYGALTTLDGSGQVEDFLASGLSAELAQQLEQNADGWDLFEYVNSAADPLRIADFGAYVDSLGMPDFATPVPVSAMLSVPIRHRGVKLGNIHMAFRDPGQEFSREDEETLVMFAAQAALVISNARTHREEQRAKAALQTLIETSPVGVVVFDARTGIITSYNRETARLVDDLRRSDQSLNELLADITVRRADGRVVSLRQWPVTEALKTGETVRAEEIALSVPGGQSVTALLNATPLRSAHGELESFVVTIQDMTYLAEQERARAEFMGMVSHELRSPLTSIRGSATTMLDAATDLDPAELRQFVRIIVDQADNMRELIDELLDVARIDAGALPVSPEPAEVARLVDRARSTFLSGGGRNNLSIELEPDLPLVMADRRRVAQVIGNLLTNAARHSPDSSQIKVSAARDGVHVAISVTDEGRGIPSGQLPGLFRKFAQSGTRGQTDTGLGLAICQGIVEAHGGRIWAESPGPSLGSRLTFTLPVVDETRPRAGRRAARTRGGQAVADPILVVDDDPQTLMQVRNALSRADYYPVVTADPEEALRLVAENRPRLVLLDLMLPGYDGVDLMGDIFAVAEVPVVFLSAYGQHATMARAFEAGASDYIVKPFAPTELLARVKAALLKGEGRGRTGQPAAYRRGDLAIDYSTRQVSLGGRPLQLTAKEYDILCALSANSGRVLTHDQLLRRVWGAGKRGNVRTLRTHVRRLRKKLGEDGRNPTFIFSEPRVGYRITGSDEGPPAAT